MYFHEDGRTFDSRLKAIAAGCLDPEEDGRKRRRKKKQDYTEGEPTRKRSAGEPRAKRKAKAKAKPREPDEDPEDGTANQILEGTDPKSARARLGLGIKVSLLNLFNCHSGIPQADDDLRKSCMAAAAGLHIG